MATSLPWLIASAVTSVGGTAYSINRQQAAASDQKRAARLEKRKAAVQNARERRRAAAEAQVMRSQVQAQQAAGGFETSGQSQQTGAINSQLAGNLSFSRQIESFNSNILGAQTSAANAQTQAGYGQAFAQLPGALGFSLGDTIRSNTAAGKTWWGGTQSISPSGSAMSNPGFSNQFQL